MSKSIQLKNKDNEKMYPHPYYPIGSIYLSVNDTNPSNWFGGTWEQISKGRTLVGVDTSDTDFNTVKKTGGEKTHKHLSPITYVYGKNSSWGEFVGVTTKYGYVEEEYTRNFYGAQVGKQITDNINSPDTNWPRRLGYPTSTDKSLLPYFTCYIWCRTA